MEKGNLNSIKEDFKRCLRICFYLFGRFPLNVDLPQVVRLSDGPDLLGNVFPFLGQPDHTRGVHDAIAECVRVVSANGVDGPIVSLKHVVISVTWSHNSPCGYLSHVGNTWDDELP